MSTAPLLLLGWVLVAAMMAALWLVQRARCDAGVVDVGWAAGLGLLAVLYAAAGSGDGLRRALVAVMVGGWSLRLAWHLLADRVIGKPEDGRYQTLRARWGDRAQARFFAFFQAQALLDVALSLPFLAAIRGGALGAAGVTGVAVWAVAVLGEALADSQLARFRADPANRGATCRIGLWRASRHPNYFFEWLHWWSYVLLAAGSPVWWLALIGPVFMLYFLLKVTGIPSTEAHALASRGDDYREYQRTTSAFVPWFPKRQGTGDRALERRDP